MKIKKYLLNKLPRNIVNIYSFIRSTTYRHNRTHKVFFGSSNADKTFYVFRYDLKDWGVYSLAIEDILEELCVILKKGYTPVFDFQNYRPSMLEDNKTFNLWYRFFEKAPDYVSLDEVYKSKNVILSKINNADRHINTTREECIMAINHGEEKSIFNQYMLPSKEIIDRVDAFSIIMLTQKTGF